MDEATLIKKDLPRTDLVIGIDPGLNGGMALLSCNPVSVWAVQPTPVISGDGEKRRYNDGQMLKVLIGWMENSQWQSLTVTPCLERQHPLPMQGVTSMFTTGFGYGLWLGLLRAVRYLYNERVRPTVITMAREWQHILVGEKAADKTKAKSIARVHRVFPDVNLHATARSTIDHDGMADAINIAHYACLRMAEL